jgi:hypothetical protein
VRIEEDVNERLTWHPYLDATDIHVRVNDGEVTLEGTVDSRQAKRLAEDVAEAVWGVTEVHNRLRVAERRAERFRPLAGGPAGRAWQLTEGMAVFGSGGQQVGVVRQVRDRDFLLARTGQRDVYVPFDLVGDATGERVTLAVRADQVDTMGWASPPGVGAAA